MSLFKFVEDLVEGLIDQLGTQGNFVEAAISSPLKKWVTAIDEGGTWEGKGATRFVQEMNSDMMPRLVEIIELISGFAGSLKKGKDRIMPAVQEANNKATMLLNLVNNIF